jgi:hypothetical protein
MKNIVSVIYPSEKTISFVHDSVDPMEAILEHTFAMFNHGSGSESELFVNSKVHSLSVNDIVCVNGQYFQCASVGWHEVSVDYVKQLESDVDNHPTTKLHGSWFGLNEVMWDRRKKFLESTRVN